MDSKLRALLLRRFNIPNERYLNRTIRKFTLAERVVFYTLTAMFLASGVILLASVNERFLVEVPIQGGRLTEGIVGNPRFINPILALSEADKNLTALVYAGLVRLTPSGETVSDLASYIDRSKDGLTYTAYIRPEAHFHDGMPVTADDVIFTIQKILDPALKSPRRGNWEGVTVEKIDDLTLHFVLRRPYAPFMENLSLGILPRHIWKNVSDDEFAFSQFNTLPVGAGPYKVASVESNSGGIPNYYELAPFSDSQNSAPFIDKLTFRFYPSEDELLSAYADGEIESFGGVSPEKLPELKKESVIKTSPLPRVFGVFFNQSHSRILALKEVRQALDLTAPRQKIIDEILGGYASAINGPFPAGSPYNETNEIPMPEAGLAEANLILERAGWTRNPDGLLEKKSGKDIMTLSFSISTGDAPELKAVAGELKRAWEELGATVEVQVYEPGDLNQSVIRPRKFDALLFGEAVGREADLYPFWHSSQRNDPGLNIALYANSRVDTLLENARAQSDREEAAKNYRAIAAELKKDVPVAFLYTPRYLYVLPDQVTATELGTLSSPQDRFLGVSEWYIETDRVWPIFANPNAITTK